MSRKVLIVDKSLYNRMILRDILISHGYSVVEASTGDEAIETYKKTRPDLVTVDIMMPGIDGVKAVREIRMIDPKATVLMCGSRGQQRKAMEGMSLGAEGILLKPFVERHVIRSIKQAMGHAPDASRMNGF
ncbi:MAG: response regulator [Armatimonadota bacterium]|nr:response regulator [Armatimonadota bacterium]